MEHDLTVKPYQYIKALSMTLELSTTGISKHHLVTAILCKAFGEAMNLDHREMQTLIVAALLHDIGAASQWEEKLFIVHNDNDDRIFDHAEKGYHILNQFPLLKDVALVVRYHHDRYSGSNPSGFIGDEIPLLSRILHFADRIDVLIDLNKNIMLQKESITIDILSSDFYDPKLFPIFEHLALKESFWLNIVSVEYEYLFDDFDSFFGKYELNIDDLIDLSKIFASIIDASSLYTYNHSYNVANVAKLLSKQNFVDESMHKKFYLAGLLHDLGKLAIPNQILNKQGRLDDIEILLMKQHPYYSMFILAKVEGFEDLANWVGHHHEFEDGFGYPDRLVASEINIGIRILQLADIFCALTENRPYRKALNNQEIINELMKFVKQKKLDNSMVQQISNKIESFVQCVNHNVEQKSVN
ncbi:MAG: HD-GYP domain-containing protein [Erysipelotrichaceae bacterium]